MADPTSPDHNTPDPNPAIDAASQRLYDDDPSAPFLGIELLAASTTHSVVQMTITHEMCNGYGIGHGGVTFLLADSAMAFASNAGGGMALATSASIDWLAPVHPGDVLTATCRLHHGAGRSKMWRISVVDQDDNEVANLTGRTRRISDGHQSGT